MKNSQPVQNYEISSFLKEAISTHQYKILKDRIGQDATFGIRGYRVKIYTPELALTLETEEIPAIVQNTSEEALINGTDFRESYLEGFKEGEQYYESSIRMSPDILRGPNAELNIQDLHMNYFHICHSQSKEGWVFVKRWILQRITHKTIKEYGYFSGIVSKVDDLAAQNRKLFDAFEKCDHGQPDNLGLSVTDWVLIFYYADSVKAFCELNNLKDRMRHFIEKNKLSCSETYFKNTYYAIVKRINGENADFSPKRISKILPHLSIYPDASERADNDIIHLTEEARYNQ